MKITRLIIYISAVFLVLACSKDAPQHKPNFIFIAVDDLNIYNTPLGSLPGNFLQKVYPDSIVLESVKSRLTPNINELANMGITFQNAFCPAPLCGPSRTALMTGVPPHVSGYYHHDKHFRGYKTLTDVITLPQYLKRNGYYTAGVGKVFHKGRTFLDRGVYSDWPDNIFSWTNWVDLHSGTGKAHDIKGSKPLEYLSRYYDTTGNGVDDFTRFGITECPVEKSNDYVNAKMIADLILQGEVERYDVHGDTHKLELPKDKPYFVACGIFAPHLPWVTTQEFYNLFPQDEMNINEELLDWVLNDLEDLSISGKKRTQKTSFTKLRNYGIKIDGEGGDINAWKAAFQAYLSTVAYSDRVIGVLLDAIKNNPEHDNTIVVLWSDHGYHMGDKNREGKTTLWEAANHCNLIFYNPLVNESSSGKRCDATVSLQDLYPTIVSLANLERPEHVHGYDLSLLLRNVNTSWNHPVLSTNGKKNHTIRTDEFRYLRYKNGDKELYNLIDDPFEFINLVNDENYSDKWNEMDSLLEIVLRKKPVEY